MGDVVRTPPEELERLYRETQTHGEYPSLTTDFLKRAADAVLTWSGTEESRRVRRELYRMLDVVYPAVSEAARQQIIQLLVDQLGDDSGESLKSLFGEFTRDRYGAALESLARTPRGLGRVVFIARRPYFQILREALHLKRLGYQVLLVSLTPLPEVLKAVFEETFDEAFEPMFRVPDHPAAMLALLRWLDADILHVQCWMFDYALARLVLENRGRARGVCEFYDVTSMVAERDVLASHWAPALVDLDLQTEAYICRYADAVVCRYPAAVAEELRQRHGRLARFLEMHPYPSPEFARGVRPRTPAADGVPRLVYTGVIVPENGVCPPELYPEFQQRRTFERLLQQGLAVDVLVDPGRPITLDEPPAGYEGFVELAQRYPRYAIRNGFAPDRVAEVLSGYDFGIVNLTEFDFEVLRLRPSMTKHAVGTKLFAYLEAELPVLVNAEYECMASLVNDHGLGIVVHSSEIDQIAAKLREFDHGAAVERIRRFNAEHGMARHIHRLAALYDDMLRPVVQA